MKNKRKTIIAAIFFLAGAALVAYPFCMDRWAQYRSSKVIDEFMNDLDQMREVVENEKLEDLLEMEASGEDVENEETDGESKQADEETDRLLQLYKDMCAYNRQLYADGQSGLKDPFSYETPSFDLTEYGFSNNVIGIIDIDSMDVHLPLYLGANKENMKKGAVVMGQTSMPTRQTNTNMVVAAHRGYRGIKMFREIENVQVGDVIKVTTPFDTLIYRVTQTKVILPEQVDETLIRPGECRITLLTCHPYTKNSHRYLVYAKREDAGNSSEQPLEDDNESSKEHRADEENNVVESEKKEAANQNDDTTVQSADNKKTGTGEAARIKDDSDLMINLEKYLPVAGIVVIIIMIVVGFFLTNKKN